MHAARASEGKRSAEPALFTVKASALPGAAHSGMNEFSAGALHVGRQ
jgi:hypothetical protein